MLEKDCYFHSLVFESDVALKIFESILKEKKILSIEKSGIFYDNLRMNKIDEICISKKGKISFFYNSAYDLFVRRNLSFMIKKDLPNVYKPELISVRDTFKDRNNFVNSGLTDLFDEYRVKDEILIDDVIGINFPVSSILSNSSCYKIFFGNNYDYKVSFDMRKEEVISFYHSMLDIMRDNDIDIPIYDIDANNFIKSDRDIIKKKRR